MKQIIQSYRTGKIELANVSIPTCDRNKILVQNHSSLISIGTERSIIELAKMSIIGKAKTRPDLVNRFINKAKNEGIVKTAKEALGRLDVPTPLGYSSSGVVIEVGKDVHSFSPGDRVSCIGAGYASHAEYILVPEKMCCRIPDSVSFEEGSFGMLGIIALHGIRCAKINFGEHVGVIGLGLLGLISTQILKAYGCKVIGLEIDAQKVDLAVKIGIDNVFTSEQAFIDTVHKITNAYGLDAVLVAAATKSEQPVNVAIEASKSQGRVVIVGSVDVHPSRNELWRKEVELIVSRAAGPGSLDSLYEHKGIDYPFGYVRWTENRNLEEFIRLVNEKKVDVASLITHRSEIALAKDVYDNILSGKGGPYIGVVLQYPAESQKTSAGEKIIPLISNFPISNASSKVRLAMIGAGVFGKALLLPTLRNIEGIQLHTLVTSGSANSYYLGRKYGFNNCSSDYHCVLKDNGVDAILVATPHKLHAQMVIDGLGFKKHVLVEKPLCTNEEELSQIVDAARKASDRFLMVGYNRRFSPHSTKIKTYLKGRRDPLMINYRINAGYVPPDHWVHSIEEGGGRIIGEVCHFVDLLQYLTESNPVHIYAERLSANNRTAVNSDNVVIALKFKDGSLATIFYTASGDRALSRELVEIFSDGQSIVLTDFRKTQRYLKGKETIFRTLNQEIGYKEELQHFIDVVSGKTAPRISLEEISVSMHTVFKIGLSIDSGKPIEI